MNHIIKIIRVFGHFCQQFPLYFAAIIAVLCVEAIVALISVVSIIPLADFMLDADLKNPNQYTLWIIEILESFRITPGLVTFASLFIVSNFIKAFLDVLLRYFTLYLKYSVFKYLLLDTLSIFMRANWSFFTRHDQGKLLNSLQKELTNVGDTMGHMATQMSQFVQVLIYALLPFFISTIMTLTTVGIAIGFALPFLVLHRLGYQLGKTNTSTANAMMSTLTETLSSMRIILSFSAQESELDRNRNRVDAHMKASIRSQTFIAAIGYIFQPFAMTAVIVAVLISLENGTTVAQIAAVIWSLIRAMPVLSRMLQTNINISNFLPSFEQIENLSSLAKTSTEQSGNLKFPGLKNNIAAENIWFSHENDKPTIKDVSFVLRKGEITAFCGLSGSGKSTLADILLGFHTPDKGEVTIDGVNIENLDKNNYRHHLGYVPQDSYLFNMSIKENLLWANPDANDNDAITALKKADAYKFVSQLPRGLNSDVGENGMLLSGGQRQRISLARALIRKPKLLILDEATSALDRPAQIAIRDMLEKLKKDTTVLIIAHQLSSIDIADQVYLLNDGAIAAQGSPEEIRENSLLFQKLFPEEATR